MLASVPLWLEYEAILKRETIRALHGMNAADIDDLLAIFSLSVQPVALHFLWRPQLNDPKDEMVLETALNGVADALVTFNVADFRPVAERLGMNLLLPSAFLKELRRPS